MREKMKREMAAGVGGGSLRGRMLMRDRRLRQPGRSALKVHFRVNGQPYDLYVGNGLGMIEPSHTLAHTLRETLGLTGTKVGCDHGACAACTVLIDGKPVLSCLTLTVECEGREIRTVEGLEDQKTGTLSPLQEAFVQETAFQCGFCTPGMLMASQALLTEKTSPGKEEIKAALSGHFCRCISHYHIVKAVMAAASSRGTHV